MGGSRDHGDMARDDGRAHLYTRLPHERHVRERSPGCLDRMAPCGHRELQAHAPDALPIPLPVNDNGRALDEPLKKLLPVRGMRPAYERSVLLSIWT